MTDEHRQWLPWIGQHVRVKESSQQGLILRIDPVRGPAPARHRRTTYRLDELERLP